MHKEVNLLHIITDIWASGDKILKSTNQATKRGGIIDWRTRSSRELRGRVDWCGSRIARRHVCSKKNLIHILVLRKDHTGCSASDRETKKVMKRTQVLHIKLTAKSSSDGGDCSGRRNCQNNVIHIKKKIGSNRTRVVDKTKRCLTCRQEIRD